MTVCIAVKSDEHIITVTDMMLSSDNASIELGAAKSLILDRHARWLYMFSTDDMTHAKEIPKRIQRHLPEHPTEDDVKRATSIAYDDYIEHRVNRYLSRYGWTRAEFFDKGLERLGPDTFASIRYEVEQMNAETELLVTGFDPDNESHVFSVSCAGEITDHDEARFHAIGSGSWAARAWLFTHELDVRSRVLIPMIYRACEAKFASETARSVGEETAVTILFHDRRICAFPIGSSVRQEWRTAMLTSFAPDAAEYITGLIKNLTFEVKPRPDLLQTEHPEVKKDVQ